MTWNEDRKQTIYGNKRREHKTHTTEVWHNSPLPEGTSRAVTVLPGRGGGHSGDPSGPTQRHTQDGASRAEQTDGGPGGAGSSGGQGRWSMVAVASSLGPASTAGTFVPPQKKSMGQLRGIRSPPGLNTHKTILKKTLVTVWSIYGHDRLAKPPNGGDRQAGGSHSRRRAEWPRTAGWPSPRTRGSRRRWVGFPHGRRRDLPRTAGSVSRGRRRELKWRVGFPRQRWPAGMSQRQSGELESVAIRQAWVRGRPAGIDSAAGRWARVSRGRRRHLLRMVGWLICERWDGWAANGGVKTREPRDGRAANGSVNSRERRAWGLAARDKTQEQTKDFKKWTEQNEVKGRRLLFGLVFCHGAHSRERRGTRRRGDTSK